eukprot:NODE_8096_length_724_cov_17.039933_g7844_i0.p1 GENE.NODE_8096_length_724_cov_17.039933_g7844_i0~~NODE_8096_length_724_cov_17.039933_g7844_i0.p1  ORF type:complete len:225 (-),score=42.39 NODE_8096_length_724_cov_17.039933_g7844_i0:49-660(-)
MSEDAKEKRVKHALVAKFFRSHNCDVCEVECTHYHCSAGCNYDICEACYRKGHRKHRIYPSNMHKLILNKLSGHKCDICNKKGTRFRCKEGCDFDLCHPCYVSGITIHNAEEEETSDLEDDDDDEEESSSSSSSSATPVAIPKAASPKKRPAVSSSDANKRPKTQSSSEEKSRKLPTGTHHYLARRRKLAIPFRMDPPSRLSG